MSENNNFSSSETKSRRVPNPFRERTSPFDNSQTTTIGPSNNITIPNKVSEKIELKKFSIDRFYPIALEQSQKISEQVWQEFCDNVDKVVGLRRWAFYAVYTSCAVTIGLWIYLMVEIIWLQNSALLLEILLVAIGFIVVLPAYCYQIQTTGKIRKKLTAFLLEFSDNHSDVEITLDYGLYHIWLEVTNMEVDWQDVEFASRMENPSSNNNNNSPPKIYYLSDDNKLKIASNYLHWRKIQAIRNRHASRGASRCS